MTPRDMAATHRAAFARSRPWSAAEFAQLLQSPGCFVTGDRRSFALVRVVPHEAELLTIATHPAHLRKGLARACMARWHDIAQSRGARRAWLEVAADNLAAIALYHACGFASAGTRPGYYRRGDAARIDALTMTRLIA